MSEFLTTREVAELLRLKERKIYDLVARQEIPFTKTTGKLLFPKHQIRSWMAEKGAVFSTPAERPNIVLGSHDPLFEWALSASGSGLPTLMNGSLDGLARYQKGEGIVCGIHLENLNDEGWNTELVNDQLSQSPCVLMHWAKRERGLLIRPGCGIEKLQDICGKRLVARQSGAAAQRVLERRLADAGIEVSQLNTVREARTETEAALSVLEGEADVTLGLRCFSDRYPLAFIPICEESFDLVVDRYAYFEPAFQALLRFTRSDAFRAEAERYSGYDLSELGAIRFNGAR